MVFRNQVAVAIFAMSVSTVASATTIDWLILSDTSGRGGSVGSTIDVRDSWSSKALSQATIAKQFHDLCLADYGSFEAFESAGQTSELQFNPSVVEMPVFNKTPEFSVKAFQTEYASAFYLEGELSGLKNRPITIRDRGVTVAGRASIKKAYVPQCSLDIKTSGLQDATPLSASLTGLIGVDAKKLVLKDSFADGRWEFADSEGRNLRVFFSVVDMKESDQLVHITVQHIQKKKKRK